MTISPERERQLLASAASFPDAIRAIQFLLTRVRTLERREAELCEMLWAASHRVRALEAEIKATDILLVSLNDREDDLIAELDALKGKNDAQVAR